ncbi:calcium/calmodulin-regulated receptor-like kinase 2 isoform X1 [Musa acuminata AAA Group]|uniref:calcium/calmodulin-regulated receptor-like kinase 2 isoform X1 n=1 Tax=Musa acuminata AAA Group TaxID=214697 RepID=UPI0031D53A8C
MGNQTYKIIIGVSVGIAVGILIGCGALIVIRLYKKRSYGQHQSRDLSIASVPIRVNGVNTSIDSSATLSGSGTNSGFQYMAKRNANTKDLFASLSGIPRYSYKDIQKATKNFTTVLGQGSFGPVYKAAMPTGELVAVKVLSSNSSQGEKEFQTEVLLLSRLHHRNLVNLVGYCVDKSQRMLIYEFMTNGNLASFLYSDNPRILSWEERLQIASDVSHGIEYLHEGAIPPVIHRDLKSANILLDKSMRAKVADFGLSKEETFDDRKSGLKGTYGYMDPDYMSTSKFTKKSDIYSFGIILFELITAINPQQGLMDYINLAVIGEDGKADWQEIVDKKLVGRSNPEEVRLLADIAYKCLHKTPRRRPSIADLTLAISSIRQRRLINSDTLPSSGSDDASRIMRRIESQQVELSNVTSLRSHMSLKV